MLVIWNRQAGRAGDAEQRDMVRREFAARGVHAEIFESGTEEDARTRVKGGLQQGFQAIVAAGGDGTVRSIALGLLGHQIPLGILPLGTAMNMANALGLPLDLVPAVEVVVTGFPRPIDVGEANGTAFLEVASIGLTAEVLAGATEVNEGRWHAALDLLRRARHHPRTRIRLELDGHEVRTRAISLVAAIGPYTGRGMLIAPEAALDDGLLDVVVFRGFGPYRLAVHLVGVLFGRRSDPQIRTFRARRVRVETRRPLTVRADSHDLGLTPVELRVAPRALRVIVPGSSPADR